MIDSLVVEVNEVKQIKIFMFKDIFTSNITHLRLRSNTNECCDLRFSEVLYGYSSPHSYQWRVDTERYRLLFGINRDQFLPHLYTEQLAAVKHNCTVLNKNHRNWKALSFCLKWFPKFECSSGIHAQPELSLSALLLNTIHRGAQTLHQFISQRFFQFKCFPCFVDQRSPEVNTVLSWTHCSPSQKSTLLFCHSIVV